ncbi:hypothetical protein Efla_001659 [Eimeria flavescens]
MRQQHQQQQQLLLLQQAVRDIQAAEFTAVDLEFTGLLLGPRPRPLSLQEYFAECHRAAREFLAPQIGICCARRDAANPKKWLLYPYTFDALPRQGRSIFSFDLRCLRFLQQNGFDFNRWLSCGLDYERLCEVQQQQQQREGFEALQQQLGQKHANCTGSSSSSSSSDEGACAEGGCSRRSTSAGAAATTTAAAATAGAPAGCASAELQQALSGFAVAAAVGDSEQQQHSSSSSSSCGGLSIVAGALIEAGAPLVVHNGLLDLLHLLEKFVEEIPSTLEAFAAEVCRLFIGGVYDTKYIATHLATSSVFGRTALQALRNHLLAMPDLNCCFCVADSCKSRFDFTFKELNVANELPEARSHEAGFDALATAQASKPQTPHACMHAFMQIVSPSLLQEGRDVLGVTGVKPGYLRLRSFLKEEDDSASPSPADKQTAASTCSKAAAAAEAEAERSASGSRRGEAGSPADGGETHKAASNRANKRQRRCSAGPPSPEAAAAPAAAAPAAAAAAACQTEAGAVVGDSKGSQPQAAGRTRPEAPAAVGLGQQLLLLLLLLLQGTGGLLLLRQATGLQLLQQTPGRLLLQQARGRLLHRQTGRQQRSERPLRTALGPPMPRAAGAPGHLAKACKGGGLGSLGKRMQNGGGRVTWQ